MSEARWYVAILVVRARVPGVPPEASLSDLGYTLIQAESPELAHARALELGERAETAYANSDGQQVVWQFIGLHDLHEVDDDALSDGTEVYSRRVRGNPDDLVQSREKLEVFWYAANRHRTAREILENE
jgi:hypothetical protein